MTKFSSKLFLCFSLGVSLAFVGCEDLNKASEVVKDVVKEVEKTVEEAPKVELPKVWIEGDRLKVQVTSDPFTIKNVIINRGNCNYVKYDSPYDKLEAYQKKYPDRKKGYFGALLRTQSGELVGDKSKIFSNGGSSEDDKYFNALDEESKSIYNLDGFFENEIKFGQIYGLSIHNCSQENILEVVLETDKGKFDYNSGIGNR